MSEAEPQVWTAEQTAHPKAGESRWALVYDPTPSGRKNPDGTTSYSLRFPALLLTDWISEPEAAARALAAGLNQAERIRAKTADEADENAAEDFAVRTYRAAEDHDTADLLEDAYIARRRLSERVKYLEARLAEAPPTGAARDVLAERARQIRKGFTPAHDDQHWPGDLARAAAAYARYSARAPGKAASIEGAVLADWPFDIDWWNPTTPRDDLVKAGALILAEIERMDRARDKHDATANGGRK